MRFPLVPLLRLVDLGPEGMPDRLRRPLHDRVPQALWTLETPGHPGLRAAPCGPWRDPGIFWPGGGGRLLCALFPAGDQEAGREDGASAGERLEAWEVGMAGGTLGDGGVASGTRLQGDTKLGQEGLDEEGMGGKDPVIRGEGGPL
jgi:hypothetical protein